MRPDGGPTDLGDAGPDASAVVPFSPRGRVLMVQAAALIVAGLTLPMFMGIVVQPLITAVERLAEVEMGPGGWIERFGRSIARAFAAKWGGLSSWASLMPPAGFVLGLWVLIRPPAVALRLFGRLPP